MSPEESKMISQMIKEYDTRVLKMLTMWHDGSVFGTSPTVLKRLFELERANRNADILVSKNTRIKYEGSFIPEDYNVTKLKEFL